MTTFTDVVLVSPILLIRALKFLLADQVEALAPRVKENMHKFMCHIKENSALWFWYCGQKNRCICQRTLIDGGNVFFIAVAQGEKPKGRIFFDMAHELGYILLHPWSKSLDLISKEEFKSRENQANRFASTFLLPKESFLQEIQAYPTDLNYYLY